MKLKYEHRILLVDDESSILKSIIRLFRKDDYRILTASNGQEGLEQLNKLKKPVSLIISDQRMPGMTGAQFMEKAKAIFPKAIRFLLTGFSDMEAVVDAINKGQIHRYLTKPWNDEDLLEQVRLGLYQYELGLDGELSLGLISRKNKDLKELNNHLAQTLEERTDDINKQNERLSHLKKELESCRFNSIKAFASLMEMHASTLAGHGKRVALLSQNIGLLLQMSNEEINQIEIAALLHDIGKLGLPDKLLSCKANKWTLEEKIMFRRHPQEGQKTVQLINKLEQVGLLIRSHHERYDGKGYPDELEKEKIPIGSRIIAVADAYDNMVNPRLKGKVCVDRYLKDRETLKEQLQVDDMLKDKVICHFNEGIYTRYDPEIVKTLVNILNIKGNQVKKEKRIYVEQLEEGMVLSRSIYSSSGRFLLTDNTVLTRDIIDKLKIIHKNECIDDVISIKEINANKMHNA